MTDGELMRLAARGDAEAFGELVERHRDGAVAYARRILGDHALAEDAVQDCFVRVYVLRDRYRDGFCFQAYLYAMVHNRCVDLLRARRRSAALPPDAADEPAQGEPEVAYLRGERRLRLLEAVERLNDADRALLTGYALDHKPYRELARERGASVAYIKLRLHRIRAKLKAAREEYDDDLR